MSKDSQEQAWADQIYMYSKARESLDDFHRSVSEKIEKNFSGYAQGMVGNHFASLHPISDGSPVTTLTTSSIFLSFRESKDALIDGIAKTPPTARASSDTFTQDDYEDRARYYERDYLFAKASDEDLSFAKRLRRHLS